MAGRVIKMIKLYHYSNQDFKGYIKPEFLGANTYSRNDKNISGLARAFYYIKAEPGEDLLRGSKYLYITEVKPGEVYNITQDKAEYINRAGRDIDKALRLIKRNYKGVIYSLGSYKVVNLFCPAKIKQRKTLTEAGKYVIFKRKGLQIIPGNLQKYKKGV
jgi:hypothetical protein